MKKSKTKQVNAKLSVEKLINKMTTDFHHSLVTFMDNLKFSTDMSGNEKAKPLKAVAEKEKKVPSYKLLLTALKKIGRPAMVSEIATRYHGIHPGVNFPDKKTLTQQLQNNASYLSQQGLITKTLVGKRSFEYALKAA
jgi:hypothetical protein